MLAIAGGKPPEQATHAYWSLSLPEQASYALLDGLSGEEELYDCLSIDVSAGIWRQAYLDFLNLAWMVGERRVAALIWRLRDANDLTGNKSALSTICWRIGWARTTLCAAQQLSQHATHCGNNSFVRANESGLQSILRPV